MSCHEKGGKKEMVVSMIQLIIELPEIESIKDKRRIITSLKDKLQKKFRLSVAEIDLHIATAKRLRQLRLICGSRLLQRGNLVTHLCAFPLVQDSRLLYSLMKKLSAFRKGKGRTWKHGIAEMPKRAQ